ncbi:hypothetical protein A7A08_02348 [Methyloligella halotolerans]|uniref:Uncharacterized protein n=1 Tax=Methyloligella halotolerans TaxID=1177755 RepID=A0A1E2RWK0_9HYPH|nr:hypothetical protein [Methyloligella halotolerans]ODA66581.1 hypothetical protein A7A08_02348 [Methyloligella halotolerans]
MSWTPNEITDREAVKRRNGFVKAGFVAWGLAFLFQNVPDMQAIAAWLIVGGLVAFIVAWNTKTKLKKKGEVGVYGRDG